jgi:hypothetical protein
MKDSYNYLFHFNEYTGKWYCFHREDEPEYWNGGLGRPLELSPKISAGTTPLEAWEKIKPTYEPHT